MITHMDRDSAVQGIQELNEFLGFFDNQYPKIARRLYRNPGAYFNLKALFTGLTPLNIVALDDFDLVLSLKQALHTFDFGNIDCVLIGKCRDTGKDRFEFINTRAVTNVACMHYDVFPQPNLVVQWLQENPAELCYENFLAGDYRHVVYGLLSGFPRSACEAFLTFSLARACAQQLGILPTTAIRPLAETKMLHSSVRVLSALSDYPDYAMALSCAESYGFGYFYCYTFDVVDRAYIDELQRTFYEITT